MSHNRGTRHKPKYVGLVSYEGRTKWVGTHSSMAAYKVAEYERLTELRAEVDRGAVIHPDGRIAMTWPDGQRALKETGRRASSVKRMREALRPFIRDFSEREAFARSLVPSSASAPSPMGSVAGRCRSEMCMSVNGIVRGQPADSGRALSSMHQSPSATRLGSCTISVSTRRSARRAAVMTRVDTGFFAANLQSNAR